MLEISGITSRVALAIAKDREEAIRQLEERKNPRTKRPRREVLSDDEDWESEEGEPAEEEDEPLWAEEEPGSSWEETRPKGW
jgi:hypothetical protein